MEVNSPTLVGGIRNFAGGGIFLPGGESLRRSDFGDPEEEWFWWFKSFPKVKTAFCEYWTSIKIKINMTCVPKEYGIALLGSATFLSNPALDNIRRV